MNKHDPSNVHYASDISPLKKSYDVYDFIPLIMAFSIVTIFAFLMTAVTSGNTMTFLRLFMAGFFLIFGALKLWKLKHFATAYSKYDLIAKHSRKYALAYPFIEIGIGIAYLTNIMPIITNALALTIMTISAVGVLRVLVRGEKIVCACMGSVFQIPMTFVTLGENLVMASMALFMLGAI